MGYDFDNDDYPHERSWPSWLSSAIIYLVVFGLVLAFAVGGSWFSGQMVSSGGAVAAAQSAGYTNVQITSEQRVWPSVFAGCDSSDAAGFKMSATNPAGQKVTLTVCGGWPFKGFTVRYP
jgi:hypothetical protein